MYETKFLNKLTFRQIFSKIIFDENNLNYFVIARSQLTLNCYFKISQFSERQLDKSLLSSLR